MKGGGIFLKIFLVHSLLVHILYRSEASWFCALLENTPDCGKLFYGALLMIRDQLSCARVKSTSPGSIFDLTVSLESWIFRQSSNTNMACNIIFSSYEAAMFLFSFEDVYSGLLLLLQSPCLVKHPTNIYERSDIYCMQKKRKKLSVCTKSMP